MRCAAPGTRTNDHLWQQHGMASSGVQLHTTVVRMRARLQSNTRTCRYIAHFIGLVEHAGAQASGMQSGFVDASDLAKTHVASLDLTQSLHVVAFADEEGLRFRSTFLGSRAFAGDHPARLGPSSHCLRLHWPMQLQHSC